MAEFEKGFIRMIFEFQLSPLKDVHPWGESLNKRLSWFILTQGDYRLKVGSDYLLNYSKEFKDHQVKLFPEYSFHTTFVDYYIVRLWEDILDVLPDVLEPVPKEIQRFVNSNYENFNALTERSLGWQESEIAKGENEAEIWNIVESATYWLNNRWLDSGYLSPSARIWIWSDENDVVITWDNSQIKVDDVSVWSAVQGNYRINKNEFIKDVRKFNDNLFSEMKKRVEIISQNWKNDDIKIDFEQLESEQNNRSTWLESKLKNVRQTDWNEVVSAINRISV